MTAGDPSLRAGAIAGVLIETVPGAEPRVAARLLSFPGIALEGGDGNHRIAATIQASDGAALEEMAQRLLALDDEILGIYPTFVGVDRS